MQKRQHPKSQIDNQASRERLAARGAAPGVFGCEATDAYDRRAGAIGSDLLDVTSDTHAVRSTLAILNDLFPGAIPPSFLRPAEAPSMKWFALCDRTGLASHKGENNHRTPERSARHEGASAGDLDDHSRRKIPIRA